MIKLVFEDEVKEKHRVLCPYCKAVIDLISNLQISEIPGGFAFKVELFAIPTKIFDYEMELSSLTETKIEKYSAKEIKATEG